MNGDDQTKLLAEIRDILREHLEVFRENRARNEVLIQKQLRSRRKILLLFPLFMFIASVAAFALLFWIDAWLNG